IDTRKYNDVNSQRTVCYLHIRYNTNGVGQGYYQGDANCGQSPDGTKVQYASSFLKNDDLHTDALWAVCYYPYPPASLSGGPTGAPGQAGVSWLPARYTNRRWVNPETGEIDEAAGDVLYAREVRRYHVWRSSSSATGPWTEVGAVDAAYGNDPVTNTLK